MRDPWQLAAERYDNAPMPTASGKRRAAARKKTWASERARKRVAKQTGLRNRRIKRMN